MPPAVSVASLRASKAFSSFAVTVVLAITSIVVVAVGVIRDSKAETSTGIAEQWRVEDPSAESARLDSETLPARRASDSMPVSISRAALTSSKLISVSRNRQPGPTQEWMGVSKLVMPLLVADVAETRAARSPGVMVGRPVGAW